MGRTLVRAGAVAVMVLALVITPLSAVLSAGHFETWLPSWDVAGRTSMQVTIEDQTGMVRAITPSYADAPDGVINPDGDKRVLIVTWLGGCSDRLATVSFRSSGAGFALTERTIGWGCAFLVGLSRSVAIYLWSPIDAASVTFEAFD